MGLQPHPWPGGNRPPGPPTKRFPAQRAGLINLVNQSMAHVFDLFDILAPAVRAVMVVKSNYLIGSNVRAPKFSMTLVD